jgi:hypothetical protein
VGSRSRGTGTDWSGEDEARPAAEGAGHQQDRVGEEGQEVALFPSRPNHHTTPLLTPAGFFVALVLSDRTIPVSANPQGLVSTRSLSHDEVA